MEITDTRLVAASQRDVWAAVHDPEILRQAIPGCQSLIATEAGMEAEVTLKIGPVKATFKGDVTFDEEHPYDSMVLQGAGKGGIAGFARGRARVTLTPEGAGTRIDYSVDVTVGGKIAQLGARLIQGTATKLSGEFFDRLEAQLVSETPAG